jgi:hypothetical protein
VRGDAPDVKRQKSTRSLCALGLPESRRAHAGATDWPRTGATMAGRARLRRETTAGSGLSATTGAWGLTPPNASCLDILTFAKPASAHQCAEVPIEALVVSILTEFPTQASTIVYRRGILPDHLYCETFRAAAHNWRRPSKDRFFHPISSSIVATR